MKKFAALSLALALCAPAFAGDAVFGIDYGRTKISDIDLKGNGAGVYGGYRFSDAFAVEAGYRRLFNENYSLLGVNGKLKGSALQLSVLGYLPLGSDFSLFGRLGANRLKAEATASAGGFSARSSDSETKAFFGVGLEYAFTPAVALRTEFQKNDSDTQTLSLGLKFSF